jgi:outer membrane immunogenic protein
MFDGVQMRRSMFALLTAVGLSASLGQIASAADMPVKALVYKAPPPVVVFSWTGLYAGVHAGYGFGRRGADVDLIPVNTTFVPFTLRTDPKGFIGGAQAGYNWQRGAFVLGLETDLSFAAMKGDDSAVPISAITGLPLQNATQTSISEAHENIKLFGTVRARLGVTPADRVLVYVTGGLAYARIDYSGATRFFIPNGSVFQGSDSVTRTGWTAGGGGEWAFAANWSLKAEYLYYDLGDHTLFTTSVQVPNRSITDTFHDNGHIVRVGLNYRFDWGGQVIAKY